MNSLGMLAPGSLRHVNERPLGPLPRNHNRTELLARSHNEKRACLESLRDYGEELHKSLTSAAFKDLPDPDMMSTQPEIRWYMRPHLIDFLIQLHSFFKLEQETLFLACTVCDRYLSKRIVYEKHYQLTVATSLWIAAKYEDKKAATPSLQELVMMCGELYDKSLFLQMERHILATLGWEVIGPLNMQTCLDSCIESQPFVASGNEIPKSLVSIASYLCEISLYDKNYLYLSSGIKVTSAVLLASKICNDDRFTTYLSQRLADVAVNSPNQAFYDFPLTPDDLNYYHSPGFHNLPFLQFTNSTIEDIRMCSLLYLKDLYKQSRIPNSFVAAAKKYRASFVSVYLDQFTSRYQKLFINLFKLVEMEETQVDNSVIAQLSVTKTQLIDYLIGLTNVGSNSESLSTFDEGAEKFKRFSCMAEIGYSAVSVENSPDFTGNPADFPTRCQWAAPGRQRSSSACLSPSSSASTSWSSVFSGGVNNNSALFPGTGDISSPFQHNHKNNLTLSSALPEGSSSGINTIRSYTQNDSNLH
ncbi:HCL611Cp [Eremothecium sinecaudum]|uniref:HCL611Cp n=1 Tax=Eremothecium sinecaudum TaxID=45286 RepID=A0A109UVX6_9SACH|nr:HCL611Cp [Eremothecium sinecaudum]AMD19540.1 HCL611Cp [Eremothecium sinecaudum]